MNGKGKVVPGATIPGNMGSAVNNQFGGGVAAPGANNPMNDPMLGMGVPGSGMNIMQNPALMKMMQAMNPQQAATMQNAQPWQPTSLANAWGSMTPPGQFIADQVKKQALLRSIQQKQVAANKSESDAKAVEKEKTKTNDQYVPQWSDIYGG